MTSYLHYAFVQQAFVTALAVTFVCSVLGVFLVLKNRSLLGVGIAHVTFAGASLSFITPLSPFFGALISALLGAFFIERIEQKSGLDADAAIGIVSASALGAGVLIASLASGFRTSVMSYLFGSILSVSRAEMFSSLVFAVLIAVLVFLFYQELVFVTVDEESAITAGINPFFLNNLVTVLTAVTVVLAMKVVGILLVSALLIIPASTSLLVAKKFSSAVFLSIVFGLAGSFLGLFASLVFDVSAAGSMVVASLALFLAVGFLKRVARSFSLKRRMKKERSLG